MNHFSNRLQRNFEDDDLLTTKEVKDVIQANSSGREISSRAISDIARLRELPKYKPGPRDVFYYYRDIKGLEVGATRGRRAGLNPTPNAIRQQKYKAKKKAAGGIAATKVAMT